MRRPPAGSEEHGAAINFATLGYALFLAAVVAGYWLLPRRARMWWLLAASLVFYASWNIGYAPGFLLLIVVNYVLGLAAAGRYARAAATTAIAIDLIVLAAFKYLDVTIGGSASIVSFFLGRPIEWGGLGIVLPLAISFVTFTLVAYIVDVYRGAPPERNLVHFAVFIAFFPRVIAGPIMRGHEFLPQLRFRRGFRLAFLDMAVPLLVSGLLKKVMADQLAPFVQDGFREVGAQSSLAIATVAVAFTFQLYLDFAGYTDMARGSARLMGIGVSRNFDWPYRSLSMGEFWRRWHMTLGAWLRDYLYFPLGGSRRGARRTYVNLMVTFSLAGLWHGAGAGFVMWGLLQGLGLSVNRWWRRLPSHRQLPLIVSWAITFTFVVLARVPFVAPDLSTTFKVYLGILVPQGGSMPSLLLVAVLAAGIMGQWTGWERAARRLAPRHTARRWLAYGVAAALAVALIPTSAPDFIYQQF